MNSEVPAALSEEQWAAMLPPPANPAHQHLCTATLRALIERDTRKVVVLDDDPTGTQTVYGVDVLTHWSVDELARALMRPERVFYILTNSRSLPANEAVALNEAVVGSLLQAAERVSADFTLVSRSDSTLRGHFPAETDALARVLSRAGRPIDAVVLVPFFEEGGRLTAGDVHWVRQGGRLVPVGQTEFAKDHVFGYTASDLRDWVAEKTGGRIARNEVLSLSLEELRTAPTETLAARIAAYRGPVIVVHAVTYSDLEAAVAALLKAEMLGRRYLYRTAASFVRIRGGIPSRDLLEPRELYTTDVPIGPGLVVVGSYVQRTTEQLARLLECSGIEGVELDVADILAGGLQQAAAVQDARAAVERVLSQGRDAVVYTSRKLYTQPGEAGLHVGARVGDALVEVIRGIRVTPSFILAKGGITSSRVATEALGVQRARVLGQISPGVPVWRLGAETRFPGMPYVVFPGNVGEPRALAEVVERLRAARR